MAGSLVGKQPSGSFEYDLLESDPELLRSVVESPNRITTWIDPSMLKLRHRIGRGPFGDVWLATYHRSTKDYDGSHEVAVKMLHSIKEDHIKAILEKFFDLFSKCQGLDGICFLHGTSIKSGKICIVMEFYEGSVGDRMSHVKGGKLLLPDVLRYGISLAKGILELHSKGLLILNLKPSNFLLTGDDKAVIGDVGIPYTLLGISPASSDVAERLGTPNYMAPEQWDPEIRGPISFESDSWGFGCSIIEMLTGTQPWAGKSVHEIYHAVVIMQQQPFILPSLPPTFRNLLLGCFLYDFRNRPLMSDIVRTLERLQVALGNDVGSSWTETPNNKSYYSEWFLMKDHLQVGDTVRSRKLPNSSKSIVMDVPEGTIVGVLESDNHSHQDPDAFVLVRIHNLHDPLKLPTSALKRVSFGFCPGDWVRLKKPARSHSRVGVLHSIGRDGRVSAAFVGLKRLWVGDSSDFQMAETFRIGQFVRIRPGVLRPRFEWPCKRGAVWATGRINRVLPNGCLVIDFPGIFARRMDGGFLADPAEVMLVSFDTCDGLAEKYGHLEDFHWAVRPFLVALGLFTAMKLGFFVGRKVKKDRFVPPSDDRNDVQGDSPNPSPNPSPWFRPAVTNVVFKEGGRS